MRSIPFLLFVAIIWCAILASGWNDIYLYKNKLTLNNYLKFWKKNSTIFFSDVQSFDIVEVGGRFYYELRIYFKNNKRKRFSISNQIDSYDLLEALESCGLKHRLLVSCIKNNKHNDDKSIPYFVVSFSYISFKSSRLQSSNSC